MVVPDASVVLEVVLGASGPGARARERLRVDDDAHVPHLVDVEVSSALRRRVRLGQTTTDEAAAALRRLGQLPADRWDHGPLLTRMWELRADVTSYDAAYVALAERLDAVLYVGDGPLSRAPGLRCPVEVLSD